MTNDFSDLRLMKLKKVAETTSLCPSMIYKLTKEGDFPAPIQLGPKRVAWREVEIRKWIESKERVAWAV